MLLVSNCDETRKAFEKAITDPQTGFKVTCEGPAAWFLGFQIKQHVTPDGKPIAVSYTHLTLPTKQDV